MVSSLPYYTLFYLGFPPLPQALRVFFGGLVGFCVDVSVGVGSGVFVGSIVGVGVGAIVDVGVGLGVAPTRDSNER